MESESEEGLEDLENRALMPKKDFIMPEDREMEDIPPLDPLWAQLLECWHCGGRPCEVDHEKERAVRIADLQFVRDLVEEKRALEAKVLQLLADMEETKAKEKMWELEKRMLLQQLAEKEEAERRWQKDKMLLDQEISRLRDINERLQKQVDIYRRNEGKLEMLQLRLESVIEETRELKLEIKRLTDSNYHKLLEIDKLKAEKEKLRDEIEAMKKENARLKSELESVKKELTDLKNDTTKDDLIEDLRKQIERLEKEKDEALKKNEELSITVRQQNLVISELQLQYTTSERLRLQLQQEVDELTAEILALRRRLNADKTFKKFVKIKRELNNVKDQNEDLRGIVKSNVSPFPTYMKEDETYNPSKIAQRAVEIVTGSKFTPRSPDTIAYELGSQSARLVHSDQTPSPRPSTAHGVRFSDGTSPGLNRPKMSAVSLSDDKAQRRASSALGLRTTASGERSPKTGRRAFVT